MQSRAFSLLPLALALAAAPALGGQPRAGASYPLTIDTWIAAEEDQLLASDPSTDSVLGPVSVWGDTAIVGAGSEEAGKGAAYVFVRSGTTWTQQAKLLASDGMSA